MSNEKIQGQQKGAKRKKKAARKELSEGGTRHAGNSD